MRVLPVVTFVVVISVVSALPTETGLRTKRTPQGGGSAQWTNLVTQQSFMKKEETTIQTIENKVTQRFQQQDQQWSQQTSETQRLESQITQTSQSSVQQYQASGNTQMVQKAQQYQQQFQQEKAEFTKAQSMYNGEQDEINQKIDGLQGQLTQLESQNQQTISQQSTMSEQQITQYNEEFKSKQTEINGQITSLLGKAKKDEQANNFVQQKMDQWQNGWAANPVVGNPATAGGPTNPAGAAAGLAGGGSGYSGNVDMTDPVQWEKGHEKMWGNFENFMGKWQNWTNDPNAGNYRLANQQFGAFDNGQFNVEKQSAEFFGPDHVANDWKFGNYTTNKGFGAIGPYGQGGGGGGDGGAGGGGGGGGGGMGGGGGGGGGGGAQRYGGGDAFWDGMHAQWRKEVGEFFDSMLAMYKQRDKDKILSKGIKYAGADIQLID